MKIMDPIKNAERLKNRKLPKLHTIKGKERKWKLLYHNHHPHLQWSLHYVQQRNLRILHLLRSHRAVQGIGIEVQSQRSLRKVITTLPQSPRKKVDIVKSLVSTFNLRIQLKNNRRPKIELSEDERLWLEQFFQRPDIAYIAPGKNQQKYLGKVNGESYRNYLNLVCTEK